MNRNERIAEVLLYAYPAPWRRAYGDELASLLASRPLSFAVITDVAFNGLLQRLERDDPWKSGAVVLFFWTLFCITWNTIRPLSPAIYACVFWPFNLVSFAVGYCTILRDPKCFRQATVASTKSALVGLSPDFLSAFLWAIHVFHPTVLDMHGLPRIHGAGVTVLSARSDVTITAPEFLVVSLLVITVQSLLLGFLGAVLARFVAAVRRGYRQA